MAEVAIITIHGMGNWNPNYNARLIRKLEGQLEENQWKQVHVEAVDYQQFLQTQQEAFWETIDDKYSLRWDFLREFMLYSFADAGAIEHSLHHGEDLYRQVHGEIERAFGACFDALEGEPGPVAVVAQSLGCEQISNYIWDAKEKKRLFDPEGELGEAIEADDDEARFKALATCSLLVTTGCNIPLFRASLPSPEVFQRPNDDFVWRNYFDRDDCLGYPIRDMSDSYKVEWIEDKLVSVGGFMTGWNPASHGMYWTDTDVVDPLRKWIVQQLQ